MSPSAFRSELEATSSWSSMSTQAESNKSMDHWRYTESRDEEHGTFVLTKILAELQLIVLGARKKQQHTFSLHATRLRTFLTPTDYVWLRDSAPQFTTQELREKIFTKEVVVALTGVEPREAGVCIDWRPGSDIKGVNMVVRFRFHL